MSNNYLFLATIGAFPVILLSVLVQRTSGTTKIVFFTLEMVLFLAQIYCLVRGLC